MFQILGECQDVAENFALALSIITLFVLCEPRDQVTIHSIMDGGYSSQKYRDIMGTSYHYHCKYQKIKNLCPSFCSLAKNYPRGRTLPCCLLSVFSSLHRLLGIRKEKSNRQRRNLTAAETPPFCR